MLICMNDLIYALSYALDAVEAELFGATVGHSRRVAYMSVSMGKAIYMEDKELLNLAAAAVLHDNALTEYNLSEAYTQMATMKKEYPDRKNANADMLSMHCRKGEENVSVLPFYEYTNGVILYHHEQANGMGPFTKRPEEVPCFSRLLHLADQVDVLFNLNTVTEEKYGKILDFVKRNQGILFDDDSAALFPEALPFEKMQALSNAEIDRNLKELLPVVKKEYSGRDLIGLAEMFARITDYKSSYTHDHSLGVADKARRLGQYYGYDDETVTRLYLAGALHDIGKLVISKDVLEKPDKLTSPEFRYIQTHAYVSWQILSRIEGLEDIASWAGFHHEKLDGSGYPFGKKAEELGTKERLMACIDIYQALTEKRPYKDGMTHEKALSIMREMVKLGKLDGGIVADMDHCFA